MRPARAEIRKNAELTVGSDPCSDVMTFLLLFLVLFAGLLAYVVTRTDEFVIARSVDVLAEPARIFPLIDDFRNWPLWAPQDRSDATFKRGFGETSKGLGAVSQWVGSRQSGEGRMQITGCVPDKEPTIEVEFEKPFKAHNINTFLFQRTAAGTRVTWPMRGTNVFLAKVFSLFVNMDRMMGAHFSSGLENLKRCAEAPLPKAPI
jgi:hypothetical protein